MLLHYLVNDVQLVLRLYTILNHVSKSRYFYNTQFLYIFLNSNHEQDYLGTSYFMAEKI